MERYGEQRQVEWVTGRWTELGRMMAQVREGPDDVGTHSHHAHLQ